MLNKMVVGVDISLDEFHVCLKAKSYGTVKILGSRAFANSEKGFQELLTWVSKREKSEVAVIYVMEATGTYYENLAYYLHKAGKTVCVELPNKIKHFAKSLNVKTKTDKVDSSLIAQIGVERELQTWTPMSSNYKQLRDLSREILSLKKEKTRAMCQLHAMNFANEKTPAVLELKKAQIEFYKQSIHQLELEIKSLVENDKQLKQRIDNIATVKGLGLITIVSVLCETNGFELFNNIRQVVSYAGLDVEMKESGKFKGKTKISKKGNARIRQCLYMPALSAVTFNAPVKALYERIVERNPAIKKKGIVAGMRKLLILIFVLWRKNQAYNPSYMWNK